MKSAHGQLRDLLKQVKRLHSDAHKALDTVHDERGYTGEPVECIENAVTQLALVEANLSGYVTDGWPVTDEDARGGA